MTRLKVIIKESDLMFCRSIEETSVKYLTNELSDSEAVKFTRHLESCISCKVKFSFIKANCSPAPDVLPKGADLADSIMMRLDTNKYKQNRGAVMKKRLVVLAACIVLAFAVTVNAEDITATINNVFNGMFSKRIDTTKEKLDDSKYVTDIYEKHKSEVDALLNKMKAGDVETLKYAEEDGEFFITIQKVEGDVSLSYGFTGHRQYTVHPSNENKIYNHGLVNFSSIEEAIESGNPIPNANYLPETYRFVKCTGTYAEYDPLPLGFYALYLGGGDTMLIVQIGSTNRGYYPDGKENGEKIQINGKEAVYGEWINNTHPMRSIYIPLEDGAAYNILAVSSYTTLSKDELVKVAESVEINNIDKNNSADTVQQ